MAMLPVRTGRQGAVLWAAAVLGCSLAIAGCRQEQVYRAAQLPAELVAAPTDSIETLSLSGLADATASSELIDCGDVLEVSIVTSQGEVELRPTPVRVGEDGALNVPLVGAVSVAGLKIQEAEQAIASMAGQRNILVHPTVTLIMEHQRVNRVTVIGAVKEPQVYELPRSNSTLLAAIVAAGGLAENAGPDVIIRRPPQRRGGPHLLQPDGMKVASGAPGELTSYNETSGGPQIVQVNLVEAAREGNGGHYVDDGDVVEVPARSERLIRVMGLVNKDGEYEIPMGQDWYLLDALAAAGGLEMQVADKVWIIRRDPRDGQMVRIQTSIREAKTVAEANVRLQAGDLVSIEETPATMLVDALTRFMRFGFSTSVPMF